MKAEGYLILKLFQPTKLRGFIKALALLHTFGSKQLPTEFQNHSTIATTISRQL